MNIFCKLFGHRMYFDYPDVTAPAHCIRWKCGHKEPGIECDWPNPSNISSEDLSMIRLESIQVAQAVIEYHIKKFSQKTSDIKQENE